MNPYGQELTTAPYSEIDSEIDFILRNEIGKVGANDGAINGNPKTITGLILFTVISANCCNTVKCAKSY